MIIASTEKSMCGPRLRKGVMRKSIAYGFTKGYSYTKVSMLD